MLRAGSSLKNYGIEASDGPIGTVSDILFDDASWKVRWVVVDTGGWLMGRKVLIHPSAIGPVNFEAQTLSVALTKAKISDSPSLLQDRPVSQQMEHGLYGYYGWDPMWGDSYYEHGAIGAPASLAPTFREPGGADFSDAGSRSNNDDPHLRSMNAVTGYHIHATDGTIGHLENLLVDDVKWTINYLVVDTRNWWPGQHVLLAPFAVQDIDWSERQVRLHVTRALVQASPPWEPAAIVNNMYEKQLHLHYGWPGYGW